MISTVACHCHLMHQLIVVLTLLACAYAYVADELQGAVPNLDFRASHDVVKMAATAIPRAVQPHMETNTEFWHGFLGAISVIIVSELGDKTFFIAAILAMRHSRLVIFAGAITALAVMTVLSAALGFATTVIPRIYTHYLSIALFVFFGVRMIKEAYYMAPDEGMDEYEEVQKSITKKEMEDSDQPRDSVVNMEAGVSVVSFRRRLSSFLSKIFFQALTLTFVAEWGDRSQIATIILAAREDPVAVSLGAVLGHSLCTLLAVIGGRIVAQWISVRTVTFIGGIVFLVFAVSSLYLGTGEESLKSL
ncbi:putative divalent cation/proton antiporter TMEM165 [Haemaphysalis longicornis]